MQLISKWSRSHEPLRKSRSPLPVASCKSGSLPHKKPQEKKLLPIAFRSSRLLVLHDVPTFRHVQAVQELPDILVPDAADLLDVGGTLGHVLEGVAGDLELILDVLGGLHVDAGVHCHAPYDLLTQEVSAL